MLEGFRDCHCHLLPGVDDGVQKMSESLEILEEWESLGVKEVWLTPHIMEDIPNTPEDLHAKFMDFTAHYTGPLKLHLAAEHMMDGLFLKRLNSQDPSSKFQVSGFDSQVSGSKFQVPTLNSQVSGSKFQVPTLNSQVSIFNSQLSGSNSQLSTLNFQLSIFNSQLLIETSYYTPPMNMGDIIEKVKSKGYEPLLAHPERYQYMDQRDYRRWKDLGVLFQMNLPSLVGAYGPEVLRKAEWLLKENMYDYCGTDTHSIVQMDRFLNSVINKKTVKKVKQIIGKQEL